MKTVRRRKLATADRCGRVLRMQKALLAGSAFGYLSAAPCDRAGGGRRATDLRGGTHLCRNARRAQEASVRAGRAQLLNTEQSVLFDAVSAYMDVVRDVATLRLRQNNVTVLQKQLDATQEQFRVGELTRTDVAQSQARLAGAQADYVTAQGQLAVSRSSFEHVIGRPAETLETQPALPKLPSSENSAMRCATDLWIPAAVRAREQEKVADYAVDDALGALLPQVSVNGEYQTSQGSFTGFSIGTQHITSVLGEVTVPIYQGGAEISPCVSKRLQSGPACHRGHAETGGGRNAYRWQLRHGAGDHQIEPKRSVQRSQRRREAGNNQMDRHNSGRFERRAGTSQCPGGRCRVAA